MSRARAYLSLGRVSNLPTVWTNALAGTALSGASFEAPTFARLGVALSFFYVGGMFLNDAFDREFDARVRPERPIPSGTVSALEVFLLGFGQLAAGIGLLAWNRAVRGDAAWGAVAAGAVLAILVVVYDAWHKENPGAPVVMGACRGVTYVTAALGAGGALGAALWVGAAALAAYVVGLTFVARQENRKSYRAGATLVLLALPVLGLFAMRVDAAAWVFAAAFVGWAFVAVRPLFGGGPVNVGRAVVRLIAGISLVDALFVAATGALPVAALCVAGLLATLLLQNLVKGT